MGQGSGTSAEGASAGGGGMGLGILGSLAGLLGGSSKGGGGIPGGTSRFSLTGSGQPVEGPGYSLFPPEGGGAMGLQNATSTPFYLQEGPNDPNAGGNQAGLLSKL